MYCYSRTGPHCQMSDMGVWSYLGSIALHSKGMKGRSWATVKGIRQGGQLGMSFGDSFSHRLAWDVWTGSSYCLSWTITKVEAASSKAATTNQPCRTKNHKLCRNVWDKCHRKQNQMQGQGWFRKEHWKYVNHWVGCGKSGDLSGLEQLACSVT